MSRRGFPRPRSSGGSSSGYPATAPLPTAWYDPNVKVDVDVDNGVSTLYDLTVGGNKENRLKYSEDFSQSEWTKGRSVIYANNILAPDGSYTAAHVRDNAVAGSHRIYQVHSGASASGRVSVYLKAAEFSKARLSIGNTVETTRGYIDVDLITGAIDSVGGGGFDATSENVGNGWWRFGISGNMVEGDLGRSLFIYLDNGTGISYGAGTGNDGIYVWGGQIQDISTDTTYLKTTTFPILAAQNATQTTPANRPLLTGLYGNKENRLKYSEDFSKSVWVKTQFVLYANNILAPDGSYTAAHVRDNAVATIHRIYQIHIGASASGRVSVYLKAAEFSKAWLSIGNTEGTTRGDINVDLITGAIDSVGGGGFDATSENVGNGWFRFGISGNMVEGDLGRIFYIYLDNGTGTHYGSGTGNDGIYVWGGQLQDISTDTTYLKTTTFPILAGQNGNKGLYFDGVNDFLTTSIAVNPTGGLWGAAVVKVSKTSTNQAVMSAYPSNIDATRRFYIILDLSGIAGKIGFNLFDGVGGIIGRETAPSTYAVGETFVLSFVYDGTNSPTGIKIFKNGVRIDATSGSTGTYVVPTAGANLEIGTAGVSPPNFFNGYLSKAIYGQGSVLADADRIKITNDLMTKFNIP